MKTLGFSEDMMTSVWRILAAILHLGNVKIEEEASVAQAGHKNIKIADPRGSLLRAR